MRAAFHTRGSRWQPQGAAGFIAVLLCASLSCGCWFGGSKNATSGGTAATGPNAKQRKDAGPPPGDLPAGPIARPDPPPDDYVGSAACAACHDDICQAFAQHPMGRSSAFTPGDADREDIPAEKLQFRALGDLLFRVERVGDRIVHHEVRTEQGERGVYDLSAPVSLAIGSGTRGTSYGINREGLIFMSPISWYARDGGYFELSPGYEHGKNRARFERRLRETCLTCHIGRLVPHPTQTDRLAPPYVREMALGCERCHGPGQKHVERQEREATASPDDSIVNPARLSPRKREAVCNQCHLQGEFVLTRFGRRPSDFRPGMEYEDVFLVFVGSESLDEEGRTTAVSQVEQMRSSACFRASDGKMGCASCHNSHEKETAAERVGFYRDRCMSCHADRGCSLPVERQNAAPASGSCIHCHMPRLSASDVVHASQTDHRILRDTELATDRSLPGASFENWQLFDGAQRRIPPWELRRAQGMAMLHALSSGVPCNSSLRDAEELLLPLTKIPLEDAALYAALGQACLRQDRHSDAVNYLKEAVRLEPENDFYLENLARACSYASQLDDAKEYIQRSLDLNPWHARNFELQAVILASLGERGPALTAADKAFSLDPSLSDLRQQVQDRLSRRRP
jgi:hypothetical protein